jgi:hypothetical protein
MEPHNELRRARGDIWPMNERLVEQRIRSWKMDYAPEEIHTVCGILEVGNCEIRLLKLFLSSSELFYLSVFIVRSYEA